MMHDYEINQNFNLITRFLHSVRYRNLAALVKLIANKNESIKVVDIGCGVAKSFQVIGETCSNFSYIGVEPMREFYDLARLRYGDCDNFQIICDGIENTMFVFEDADLIIGLESFEHIPESLVVRIVEEIGTSDFKILYITVPNEIGPAIFIKNVGSFLMGYHRYKEYSWRETLSAAFYNLDKVERHDTGHIGFDWRWLAQTIRQNCQIDRITTSPAQFIPRCISPSIGFICRNDKANYINH